MKRVLLPTDFSDNSKNAVDYALQLLSGQDCTLYMLNVQKASEFTLDDMYSAPAGASVHQAILKDNKQELKEYIQHLTEKYSFENFKFIPSVDYDVFTAAVQQLVDSENIDLIIMGSNGATGAREVLFGSNTLKVIRKVDCPVLIVPEDYRFKALDAVLFTASTCRDLRQERAQTLKDVMALHQPQLHILKIRKSKEANNHACTSCLNDLMDEGEYQSHTLYGIPTPIASDSFVQLFNIDLHALFVERESFMDRFLHGSDTSQISYGSRVPLLLMHK